MPTENSGALPTMPDIFEYGDYRRYLHDWFDARKASNRGMSHRWLMKAVGSSDPSMLAHILSGRRSPTAERVERLIEVIGLEGDASAYFRALVAFAQAGDSEERSRCRAAVADLLARQRPPGLGENHFAYLSSWSVPAVLELAHFPDFEEDPAWIAARLDPPVTLEEARRNLEICVSLGLVGRDATGRLRPMALTLRTPENVEKLASWPFVRDGIALAARGIELQFASPEYAAEAVFLGCSLAVPASRIPELRRRLFEMQSELATATEPWLAASDRVVQLSISLVPVARPPSTG